MVARDAGLGQLQGEPGRHAGQEGVVHARRAEARPQAGSADAAIKTGHRADAVGLQRRGHTVQVVRRDDDVAVGQHHHLARNAPREVDEIVDLAVAAVAGGVDHEFGGQPGGGAGDVARAHGVDDLARDRRRGVGRVMHAEQDLHRPGVILPAKAQEIVAQPGSAP